jgi:hypothetical protein
MHDCAATSLVCCGTHIGLQCGDVLCPCWLAGAAPLAGRQAALAMLSVQHGIAATYDCVWPSVLLVRRPGCVCMLLPAAGCPAAVCMLAVPTATTWWLLGQLAAFILIPRRSWNKYVCISMYKYVIGIPSQCRKMFGPAIMYLLLHYYYPYPAGSRSGALTSDRSLGRRPYRTGQRLWPIRSHWQPWRN